MECSPNELLSSCRVQDRPSTTRQAVPPLALPDDESDDEVDAINHAFVLAKRLIKQMPLWRRKIACVVAVDLWYQRWLNIGMCGIPDMYNWLDAAHLAAIGARWKTTNRFWVGDLWDTIMQRCVAQVEDTFAFADVFQCDFIVGDTSSPAPRRK